MNQNHTIPTEDELNDTISYLEALFFEPYDQKELQNFLNNGFTNQLVQLNVLTEDIQKLKQDAIAVMVTNKDKVEFALYLCDLINVYRSKGYFTETDDYIALSKTDKWSDDCKEMYSEN